MILDDVSGLLGYIGRRYRTRSASDIPSGVKCTSGRNALPPKHALSAEARIVRRCRRARNVSRVIRRSIHCLPKPTRSRQAFQANSAEITLNRTLTCGKNVFAARSSQNAKNPRDTGIFRRITEILVYTLRWFNRRRGLRPLFRNAVTLSC